MSDDNQANYAVPIWRPGAVREAVMAAAEKLVDCNVIVPPLIFYEALADHAEDIANEAIAEAVGARDDASVVMNIRSARRILHRIEDEIFLATEQAADANLARLAAYFVLEGNDGYTDAVYHDAWGAHGDPERGTIWGIHQEVRDFTPAFIFKVCMRGDVRLLAVECHAPARRLPDDPEARLRARTMIVSGIPVLAFAPAEIEADAAACASEVCGALATLAQELLALHGLEPPPRRDFRPGADA